MRIERNQTNFAIRQLNPEPIAGPKMQLLSVGTANHQIAVEMHVCVETQLPATGSCAGTIGSPREMNALGLKHSRIEIGEAKVLAAIARTYRVTTGPHQFRATQARQLSKPGKKSITSKHHDCDNRPVSTA
jgi:hypothetical protein